MRPDALNDVERFFIRVSAFLRREIFDSLRQPRLMLTLVFGPFLILLLFGVGYRAEPRALRTLFVVEENSPFRQQLDEYTEGISPQLEMEGTTPSLQEALRRLRRGDIDLVVTLPEDPITRIRDSEHPKFTLYHNQLDPYQADYIDAFARVYVDQINERVLADVTQQSQQQSNSVEEILAQARQAAEDTRQALAEGNRMEAVIHRNELADSVQLLSIILGASTDLMQNVQQRFGAEAQTVAAIKERLRTLSQQTEELSTLFSVSEEQGFDDEVQRVRKIEEEAASLESALAEFQAIEPGVLVSPFDAQVQSATEAQPEASDYYVPAVIALLGQHLAVTFAALSIVRERRVGTIELFQVSPLTALEALLGKYLSYFLLEGLLLAVLTALSLWALGVPMLGHWATYTGVIALLIFAGLGLGFVISLLAHNTSQAVQSSMIILLASIFFSGLFLSLELLRPFVRAVSWLLPATYGTQTLQDVMLRGIFPMGNWILLGVLLVMGLGFFLLAWYLLRRRMRQE